MKHIKAEFNHCIGHVNEMKHKKSWIWKRVWREKPSLSYCIWTFNHADSAITHVNANLIMQAFKFFCVPVQIPVSIPRVWSREEHGNSYRWFRPKLLYLLIKEWDNRHPFFPLDSYPLQGDTQCMILCFTFTNYTISYF